jgi:spore coat polysaccharide biosynthesis predicted glycosyltransferase SpsG
VLRGERYLMLNPELARYRRPRSAGNKYIVSLGGADTYGVTPKVMRMLADAGRHATVILGPAFTHFDLLTEELAEGFDIKRNVKSLAEEFDQHDIAVTGGGMTPFEANACGLPCIVIANEDFEIPVGQALARFGAAVFAGHHSSIDRSAFARDIPVAQMSRAALEHIDLGGLPRVVEAVLSL